MITQFCLYIVSIVRLFIYRINKYDAVKCIVIHVGGLFI